MAVIETEVSAAHFDDVPICPVIYDDSYPECGNGPLGEVRYNPNDKVPHDPHRLAIINEREDGSAWSFQQKELYLRGARLAEVLRQELGLERGDALCFADVSVANQFEYTIACQRLGVVTITLEGKADRMLRLCEKWCIKAVIVESRKRQKEVVKLLMETHSAQEQDPNAGIMGGFAGMLSAPAISRPAVVVSSMASRPKPAFGRGNPVALFSSSEGANETFQRISAWTSLEFRRPLPPNASREAFRKMEKEEQELLGALKTSTAEVET